MADAPQSFERHARIVFGYHRVTVAFVMIVLIWAVADVLRTPGAESFVFLCLALGLFLTALYARIFANRNQDRIIRLEERLRMKELLPSDQRSRINEFTTRQLVALRFASDEELPALAAQVLNENIADAKQIKSMIKNWRADHQRA